jgi:hypothetical protein
LPPARLAGTSSGKTGPGFTRLSVIRTTEQVL